MSGNSDISENDQALIAKANLGDTKAMEALYHRYREWIYGFAMHLCHDPDQAADVLQDVFAYFLQKFPGFELRCQLKTFLYPVVKNISLQYIRKRQRLQSFQDTEALSHEMTETWETAICFADLISKLPLHEQDVVILRFDDNLSLAEIAEKLDISLGTVKSRLHRALTRLRSQC